MATIQGLIEYVESWRFENGIVGNDVLTQEQLIKLAGDVQNKIGGLSFEAPIEGANIITYNGRMGDKWAWEVAQAASESSGGTLCYISDIEAGELLNNQDFRRALQQAAGNETLGDNLIDGARNENGARTPYGAGDVLSVNDYVSRQVMLANAHGNVITFTAGSTASDSVWALSEINTLLGMPEVTSIEGIPKEDLIHSKNFFMNELGYTELEALDMLREEILYKSLSNMSEVKVYRTEPIVVMDSEGVARVTYDILGVDTSKLTGGSSIDPPAGTFETKTVAELMGQLSDADLRAKYPSLNEFVQQYGESKPSIVKEMASIVRLMDMTMGENPQIDLKSEYAALSEAAERLRTSEYLKVRGTTFEALGKIGSILLIVDGINMISEASDAYKAGDTAQGDKIVRDWLCEIGGGFASSALFIEAVSPLALALSTCGGPLGIVAGIGLELTAGIAGWVVGSEIGHAFSDLLADIRNLFGTAEATTSPLILDLDGDGVETTLLGNGINFDHDNNGFAEQSAWVGADDGLLVRDLNGNGIIDNGTELFGNNALLNNGTKAANGFEALVEIDSNSDGKIDFNDAAYSQLLVWKDADGDGVTDNGELISLADAGVTSINTDYIASTSVDEQGNEHQQIGTYTKTDGTTASIDDVWFKMDAMYSIQTELLEETAEISALPDLQGSGNVYSLHQAMLRDSSNRIQTLVEQFAAESDRTVRKEIMTNLIYAWAGVEDIDPESRAATRIYGNVIGDARKLEALEKFIGEEYLGTWCWGEKDPNPHGKAAPFLLQAFDELLNFEYAQLMAQTHLKELYSSVDFTWDTTTNSIMGDLSGALTIIEAQITADPDTGKELLSQFVENMYDLKITDDLNFTEFRDAFVARGIEYAIIIDTAGNSDIIGTTGNDSLWGTGNGEFIQGLDGNDTLTGNAGNDVLDGGAGNDQLNGGAGNDIYDFGKGYGADVIYDNDSTVENNDIIRIAAGTTADEIQVFRSGNDLQLHITGTADMLTIEGYFASPWDGTAYTPTDAYKVEQIEFADGTIWDEDIIRQKMGYVIGTAGNDTIQGSEGNDTLEAGNGADILIGGSGNDSLFGGAGSDIYEFSSGFGQDEINDFTAVEGETDAIQFNEGIQASDTKLKRVENDLEITFINSTDQLIVKDYFYTECLGQDYSKIEEIRFADGTVWGIAAVKEKVSQLEGTEGNDIIKPYDDGYDSVNQTIQGYGGDDTLYGYSGDDTLDGGAGDDILNGGTGNDTLYGGSGNDTLDGGNGDDILDGGVGDDVLDGGLGSDTYVFSGSWGSDTVKDRAKYSIWPDSGVDKVKFSDILSSEVELSLGATGNGSNLTVKRTGTSDQVILANFFGGDRIDAIEFADGEVWSRTQMAFGTNNTETLTSNNNTNIIFGFGGNDSLVGSTVGDLLYGGDGDDIIEGGLGNDVLAGGSGNDTYIFNSGFGQDIINSGQLLHQILIRRYSHMTVVNLCSTDKKMIW